ncbi:uncharacterized protein LOC135109480 [Scylla paramamosain]|uniref:uncharacterized protein LOC135109480 n=1 Tax=Scylla paramamosain TaxID=85552 RepID=UPI003082D582
MEDLNIEWTRANTQLFIELLKEHPCLWQLKNKNYKNKTVRSRSLDAMTKQLMGTMNCLITPAIIMKKLHTLRSQFRRELKQIKTSQKSGTGTNDLYVPKLWCYDALAFLGDGDTPRDSTLNLDEVTAQESASDEANRETSDEGEGEVAGVDTPSVTPPALPHTSSRSPTTVSPVGYPTFSSTHGSAHTAIPSLCSTSLANFNSARVVVSPTISPASADSASSSPRATKRRRKNRDSNPAEEVIRRALQEIASFRSSYESEPNLDYGFRNDVLCFKILD